MDQTKKALSDAFRNAVEQFAYMFAEPYEIAAPPPSPGPCLMAEMSYVGPISGTLTMVIPESLCPAIAANALGLDPDEDDVTAGAHDAIKELLNITCGQMLTALAGEEPVFDLTIPIISPFDIFDWEEHCAKPNTVIVLVDDEPALVHLAARGDSEQ